MSSVADSTTEEGTDSAPEDTTDVVTESETDDVTEEDTDATEIPSAPDSDFEWVEVNDTVYTFKSVALREAPGGDSIMALDAELALNRTRVSDSWSFVSVKIDGETLEGYVSNTYITETDILGTDFTNVAGGSKTMYATIDGLNVRKYPTTNSNFSYVVGTLSNEDAVTVVAENGSWYKIVLETADEEEDEPVYAYVSARYLANEKGGTPVVTPSYESSFIECNPTKTMYTTTAGLRLRSEPVISSETVITTLSTAGVKVIVLKVGNVSTDGETTAWSYVKAYLPPEKEGAPSTTREGYLTSAYLTEKEPASTSNLSLGELLVRYPSFVKGEKFVYVIKGISLNVRSTPALTTGSVDSDESNVIGSLFTAKDAAIATAVKVVAQGIVDGNSWYLIQYREPTSGKDIYAFISASANLVTDNASGEFKLTRDNLTATYPKFTLVEAQTITAITTANGYLTPAVAQEVPYSLKAGDQATLIARETGSAENVWYVIEVSGNLYFVPIDSFAPIVNG